MNKIFGLIQTAVDSSRYCLVGGIRNVIIIRLGKILEVSVLKQG